MTLGELRSHIARVSYKPGLTLAIEGPDFAPRFTITGDIVDANDWPHFERPFHITYNVPINEHELGIWDDRILEMKLRDWLWTYEQHEMNEFLRFDGTRLSPPHVIKRDSP